MTLADIERHYSAIVDGLSEFEVAAVWAAAVLGRRPAGTRLALRIEALDSLRRDVGLAAKATKDAAEELSA
jgi:hypothetical protein